MRAGWEMGDVTKACREPSMCFCIAIGALLLYVRGAFSRMYTGQAVRNVTRLRFTFMGMEQTYAYNMIS